MKFLFMSVVGITKLGKNSFGMKEIYSVGHFLIVNGSMRKGSCFVNLCVRVKV